MAHKSMQGINYETAEERAIELNKLRKILDEAAEGLATVYNTNIVHNLDTFIIDNLRDAINLCRYLNYHFAQLSDSALYNLWATSPERTASE